MKITFEIDTKMTAERIKTLFIEQIESGEIWLENPPPHPRGAYRQCRRAEIDADSVVVQEESK